RHFRLVLTTQAQRAEEARQQAISGGTEPSAFPDTLPGYTEYGRDNGIRLSAVWLTHDPEYPENLPAAPLVRYGWTPRGELAAVYDRSNTQVRSFTYDDKYRGRMVAHRHTGRPEICYRYDSDGRVTEQLNPAGLSYTYQYESRYGQLLSFTDCSGYVTRYDHDRFGQVTAVHREEGLSQYRAYDSRGQLIAVKDTQGHETRYEYNAAGDLTTVIAPDGSRNGTQYDAWGKAICTTQGGLTRSMEYDAAGRVIRLTSENGSHTTFRYDVLDRLIQETGFDGRTQRYHHDLTGKLIRSEDEGLVTHWHYDEADRLTHRTVNGETAERWQYDERGWLTDISHISEGHRVTVHYGYDSKGRLASEHLTVHHPQTNELLWQHETRHAYNAQG
ncbi:TPA: RHS element protein, partial [Escherichia coli]